MDIDKLLRGAISSGTVSDLTISYAHDISGRPIDAQWGPRKYPE